MYTQHVPSSVPSKAKVVAALWAIETEVIFHSFEGFFYLRCAPLALTESFGSSCTMLVFESQI